MLIYERDPRQRQLPQLFVPQEPRRVMPAELAEEIILVHPVQPPTASFNEIRQFTRTGAVGVLEVLGDEPPEDSYLWVHIADCQHTDVVVQDLHLEVQNVSTGAAISITDRIAALPADRAATPRSLLIARGFRMRGRVDALAVGATMRMSYFFLTLLEGEMHPSL